MAMKVKNLPEVVPELFEHDEFGQFRFIKRGEEIWFVAVDVCRALGYANSRDALTKHVDAEDKRPDVAIRYVSSNGVVQNRKVTLVNESGMYMLIFSSNLPAAKKFTRWITNEVLPSIRKYGFYRIQQPEQEKISIEITGKKNFDLFKAKYPDINFNDGHCRLGFITHYDEHGYYYEEDTEIFHLKLYPEEFAKISRDLLSTSCIERFVPRKNCRISIANQKS